MNKPMKKYFTLCLSFILMACSSPAAKIISTETLLSTSTPIPILPSTTPESQPFFTVLGDNPIIPRGQVGAWDDRFTDPGAVVYYDGIFHMFRNGFRDFPATSQVGYVTSTDGYTWIEQGSERVFKTSDVPYAKIAMYASSALVEGDGTWVIYFYTWDSAGFPSASVIGRATAASPNSPWAVDAEPVLKPGSVHEWDSRQVLAPHVIKTKDGYLMYYSGANNDGIQQIGMATSTDGRQWVKYNDTATSDAPYLESDPVLKSADKGSWDAGWVHQPRVFQTEQGWTMIYRGTKDVNGGNMALGLAASNDGIHWNKSMLNPVFLPAEIKGAHQFWFHDALLVNGKYYLFIEGDINQRTQIYLATHEGVIPK